MNKVVSIIRHSTNELATYGTLRVIKNDKIIFECCTLERGWLDNQTGISCIPAGIYNVTKTYSNRFKKPLYLINDVPGRAGIRIHPANFASQLNGCVALGSSFADINNDGILDVTNSVVTQNKFDEVMNNMPFKLEIVDWFKNINNN